MCEPRVSLSLLEAVSIPSKIVDEDRQKTQYRLEDGSKVIVVEGSCHAGLIVALNQLRQSMKVGTTSIYLSTASCW